MAEQKTTLERAKLILNVTDTLEDERLLYYISLAEKNISSKLKKNIVINYEDQSMLDACAFVAAGLYIKSAPAEKGNISFKAGDITVEAKNARECSNIGDELIKNGYSMLSSMLFTQGFYFGEVK